MYSYMQRALSTYRKDHQNHISDNDHLQFLQEFEWTEQEYERGNKERDTNTYTPKDWWIYRLNPLYTPPKDAVSSKVPESKP